MKKTASKLLFIIVAVFITWEMSFAEDISKPEEIIQKSFEYAMSLDSYSYLVLGEGWDMNPSDTANRTAVVAGEAATSFKSVSGMAKDIKESAEENSEEAKPEYKKYKCGVKFKKPFLLQMKVIMSEYVPQIIYGSLMTYRPDKNPDIFWFKPKISPMAIKRDINSESGDLLYSMMQHNYAIMESMSLNAEPALTGTKEYEGKELYQVEWAFKPDTEFKSLDVDFDKYMIHEAARTRFQNSANSYIKDDIGKMVYYFDKDNLLVVMREVYNHDGSFRSRKQWKDLKINHLKEKDF
ncbi:MAG TPA: hypothetical protein PLN69_05170 [bacterium]|nr:hypothetical protein [bacterium]